MTEEAVPEVTANLKSLSKFVDRENMWVSGSYALGKATALSDLDVLVGVTDDVFNEPMGLRLRDIEDDIWKTLPKADVYFYNLSDRNRVIQIPAFTKPGGIVKKSIVENLWKSAKSIREIATPAVEEVPVEREARIKYFRQEEAKWRETAYKIAEEERGEAAFASAIKKADEFGAKASELEALRPPAVKTEEWKLREAIADTAYGLAHGVKEEDIRKHLTRNPRAKYWLEPEDVDYILKEAKREVAGSRLESVVDYDRQYSLEELREMARQASLSPSGSKKEIAARLIAKGVT